MGKKHTSENQDLEAEKMMHQNESMAEALPSNSIECSTRAYDALHSLDLFLNLV
jgi:hypothetical protein